MSDATIIAIVTALVAAIPPTIMALAALRVSQKNTVIAEDTNHKAEVLVEQTEKIHDLTNSNLTAVKADLVAATEQIKDLQALVKTLAERKHDANK